MLTEAVLCLPEFLSLESQAWFILSKEEVQGATKKKRLPLNIYPVHFWMCLDRQGSGSSRKQGQVPLAGVTVTDCPERWEQRNTLKCGVVYLQHSIGDQEPWNGEARTISVSKEDEKGEL